MAAGQCRVMVPSELCKVWVQAKELGLHHSIPNSSCTTDVQKPLVLQRQLRAFRNTKYSAMVGTVRPLCYTLIIHFPFSMTI